MLTVLVDDIVTGKMLDDTVGTGVGAIGWVVVEVGTGVGGAIGWVVMPPSWIAKACTDFFEAE